MNIKIFAIEKIHHKANFVRILILHVQLKAARYLSNDY